MTISWFKKQTDVKITSLMHNNNIYCSMTQWCFKICVVHELLCEATVMVVWRDGLCLSSMNAQTFRQWGQWGFFSILPPYVSLKSSTQTHIKPEVDKTVRIKSVRLLGKHSYPWKCKLNFNFRLHMTEKSVLYNWAALKITFIVVILWSCTWKVVDRDKIR